MIDDKAKTISLMDYKERSIDGRTQLLLKFNITPPPNTYSSLRVLNLNAFIGQADPQILKNLSLEDLIIPFKHSKLKFALLDDNTFSALTLKDLEGLNSEQFLFIQKRQQILSSKDEKKKPIFDFNDFEKTPLRTLSKITPQKIQEHKEKFRLPPFYSSRTINCND